MKPKITKPLHHENTVIHGYKKNRMITIFLTYLTLFFPTCLFWNLGTIVMVQAPPSAIPSFKTSFSSSLASSSVSLDAAEPQSEEVAEW